MIKLDDNLLQELGLGALPPEEKKKMLAHIYETLEMRVGMELAKQMTEAQLSEFEQFINRNDEAGALQWLETNFPHYKQVVADEFEKLKAEIKAVAPQILAASQQQQQAAVASGAQPQPGPMGVPNGAQPYAPQPQPFMPPAAPTPGPGQPPMPPGGQQGGTVMPFPSQPQQQPPQQPGPGQWGQAA